MLRQIKRGVLLGLVLLVSTTAYAQTSENNRFARIDELRDQGQYEQALTQLEAMRQQNPNDAEVLWRLALTHVDLGEAATGDAMKQHYQEAMEVGEAAVEADDTNTQAHVALATAAGRMALISGTRKKVELSRTVKEHADRALALDPDNEMAYHVRGRWNYGVSDLNWFERTIVKAVYGGLPEASFEQAARDLEQALQLGDKVVHHLELGRTYMKLDRKQEAKAQFEQALEMPASDPQDPNYKKEAQELLKKVS